MQNACANTCGRVYISMCVCAWVCVTGFSCFLALKSSRAFWACLSIWHKTFAGSFRLTHDTLCKVLIPSAPPRPFLGSLLGRISRPFAATHQNKHKQIYFYIYLSIYCPWRMSPANEPRTHFPFFFLMLPFMCSQASVKKRAHKSSLNFESFANKGA